MRYRRSPHDIRTKRTKLEFSNAFFSNWVKIRQKVNRTKVAWNFKRINMVPFFLRNSQQKNYPKNGSFWLFQLIKNYAETFLLIDKKIMSKEAPYKA